MDSRRKIQKEGSTKVDSVLTAARKLFLASGYGSTSVDAIAEEAGVSKATIYAHFASKERLFADSMMALCEELGGPQPVAPHPGVPAEEVLRTFARRALEPMLRQEAIAAFRAMAAEACSFPALGQLMFESGMARQIGNLSIYLREKSAEGELRIGDPELAASQFIGLIQGTLVTQLLLGAGRPLSEDDVRRHVDHGVEVFLHGTAGRSELP